MKHIVSLLFVVLLTPVASAQVATQILRGRLTEEVTKAPVVGATVLLIPAESGQKTTGAVTDQNGYYKLTNVPLGRQTIRVSYVGYEEITLPNIVVTAGKEVILNLSLTEKVTALNEVVVAYDRTKDKTVTNNELVLVSGRSFNTEDTKRFAGSLGDPSRMAANFAGVVSGNDSRNDIVVRGNSPAGMLWQLEGLNIPNPNHFSTIGTTGGPVSVLNANNLGKSDFLTGAFPAQYGNALSGAFDLRLRNGNDEKHEFLAQVGFNGFEFGAEGPLKKGANASYMVNYRYSTLGLFKTFGINFGTTGTPNYQDLTVKLMLPTGRNGKVTFFGIGGLSDVAFLGNEIDTTKGDLYGNENANIRSAFGVGVAGLSYEYNLTTRTFAKLTLGVSGTKDQFSTDSISSLSREAFLDARGNLFTQKYAVVGTITHKFDPKNSLYAGITLDRQDVDLFSESVYAGGTRAVTRVNSQQRTTLTQAYTQWRHRFSNQLTLTAGVHAQHYSLGNHAVAEPRVALKYLLGSTQSIAVGYGLNSQVQSIYTSLVQTHTPAGIELTNKGLGFTRSHQTVLTYENKLSDQVVLKVEGYYQSIFNAPVEQRKSSYSALNSGATFTPSDQDSLVNKGTGTNYGVEVTLERSFNRGYYSLLTGSLFDSKYKGSDGIERNTAFNSRYVLNVLAGREMKIGPKRTNVLAVSLKMTTVGGRYFSPVDREASRLKGEAVYDEHYAYSVQQSPYFRADLKLAYRRELQKSTLEIALDLQNVTNNRNIFQQTYNVRTNAINNQYQQSFFPVPFVRYTF